HQSKKSWRFMIKPIRGRRMREFHGTTIVCVKKDGHVAMGGDGQVTLGQTAIKHTARKVRKIYNDKVMVGFSGRRQMPLPFLISLSQSLKSIGETSKEPP